MGEAPFLKVSCATTTPEAPFLRSVGEGNFFAKGRCLCRPKLLITCNARNLLTINAGGRSGKVDAALGAGRRRLFSGKLFGSGCCRVFSILLGFNRIDEILADGSRAVTGVGSRRVGLGAAFGLRLRGCHRINDAARERRVCASSTPVEVQAGSAAAIPRVEDLLN